MSKSPRIVPAQTRGQKKPFTPAQLDSLRAMLATDLQATALLNLAVDSMLRSSDLLNLTASQVTGPTGIRAQFVASMKKEDGRSVVCVLTPKTQAALAAYISAAGLSGEAKLFDFCAMTLQRTIKSWARSLGLDPAAYSGHSLRRTKASVLYDRTRDVERIRLLLGHRWLSSTQAYLGCDVDSALALAQQHDV
jgi:integrase